MDSTNLVLVRQINQKIELDSKSSQKSNLLKDLITDINAQQEPIQLHYIKYEILKKVVEYLTYYKDKTQKRYT